MHFEKLEERALLNGDPPPLPIGQWTPGTLTSDGDSDTYFIDVAAGEQLILRLDADGSQPDNELYVRYAAPPTRTEFDAAAKEANHANQMLTLPVTQAGTYYVMVYASCVFPGGHLQSAS